MRNFWMDHLLERVIKKVYIRNGYDFYQPSIKMVGIFLSKTKIFNSKQRITHI